MKFKICNICADEKFIDNAIEGMDLFADKWNSLWIICQNTNNELRYIKKHINRITKVQENNVLNYISEYGFDAVILHSYGVISPTIIKDIPRKIKLFWFGWGYDIYNFPENKPFLKWNLYKPLTYNYINPSVFTKLRHIASHLKFYLLRKDKVYCESLKRIDYFSGVVDFEYDLLKRNPNFRAQKVLFSYSNPTELDTYEHFNGNNILVGNSAAFTNNHLDLLEHLKPVDLSARKIILPLSYAGTIQYGKKIENAYKQIYGNNVIALIDFMPYDEYKRYIQSCSIAIFFMVRQQAMGNIKSSLKYGCKVFLSEDNPVYKYFKDLGMIIFSVEKDFNTNNLAHPLTDIEIKHNRNILNKLYDYNAYIRKLETIYNKL